MAKFYFAVKDIPDNVLIALANTKFWPVLWHLNVMQHCYAENIARPRVLHFDISAR